MKTVPSCNKTQLSTLELNSIKPDLSHLCRVLYVVRSSHRSYPLAEWCGVLDSVRSESHVCGYPALLCSLRTPGMYVLVRVCAYAYVSVYTAERTGAADACQCRH